LVDLVDGAKRTQASTRLVRVARCTVSLPAYDAFFFDELHARALSVASLRIEAFSVKQSRYALHALFERGSHTFVKIVVAYSLVTSVTGPRAVPRNASLALTGEALFSQSAKQTVLAGSLVREHSWILARLFVSGAYSRMLARRHVTVAHKAERCVKRFTSSRPVADIVVDARAR